MYLFFIRYLCISPFAPPNMMSSSVQFNTALILLLITAGLLHTNLLFGMYKNNRLTVLKSFDF